MGRASVMASSRTAVVLAGSIWCAAGASAQVVQPPFEGIYSVVNLGPPQGVPASLGGVTFKAGDPDTLLIGGSANGANAAVYEVPLERTCGRITGFAGAATLLSTAPNIDGGLSYGPDGILFFTRYSMNGLGQILPGSSEPDRLTALTPLGVPASVGTLAFVPPGFPNAGALKVATYNGGAWSELALELDVDGTYEVTGATVFPASQLPGGPEGIVFIRGGQPQFAVDSVLISQYGAGAVSAFEIDAQANPIPATARPFITGLGGAEGAAIDPLTGDFVFSTFGGGGRVVVVRGFNGPCPGDVTNDGVVNFADLNAVLNNFGSSSDEQPGDANNDCVVNFGDLNLILNRFGTQCE